MFVEGPGHSRAWYHSYRRLSGGTDLGRRPLGCPVRAPRRLRDDYGAALGGKWGEREEGGPEFLVRLPL